MIVMGTDRPNRQPLERIAPNKPMEPGQVERIKYERHRNPFRWEVDGPDRDT